MNEPALTNYPYSRLGRSLPIPSKALSGSTALPTVSHTEIWKVSLLLTVPAERDRVSPLLRVTGSPGTYPPPMEISSILEPELLRTSTLNWPRRRSCSS